ncbi:ATPase involved in chromosome partitioning [Gynuella sunshinyii YC6258]|uniref:non-specific protein-tyrosine kinase n=1 Tax=Gynuella sunshinyii YC6258 TaxID=1445510 RepID=A0A0C5VQ86_9GAMM|nr:ATPase involved in chromosome partitioning [Gynuella sunshinyii YC6258]
MAHSDKTASSIKNIEYTQTKILPVSADKLRANRIVAHDPTDPNASLFQVLRTKVLQEMRLNNWNTLAITAPTPGAGKSMISVNLAISIAMEVNQTVLLVDMDFRKPSIHKYFSVKPKYGLQDCLQSGVPIEDVLFNPGFNRLVVLPGRQGIMSSSELISSPESTQLIRELKEKYDQRLVIFDLPPLFVSDDVMVFLPNVDCSLLVVESGRNNKDEVQKSVELLKSKPLLGTVLNKEAVSQKIYFY